MLFDKRRKFKNLLISPEIQTRFALAFLATTIIANIVFTILGTHVYYSWINGTMEESKTSAPFILFASCLIVYGLIYAFAFILGFVISHRFFGPLVPIGRMLDEMKNGNFKERLKLRNTDDAQMQKIAQSLNELAETLEKKSSPSV